MNREEAIKFFELQTQDEQALIDGINLNPDDFVFGAEGPEQYINDCQNNIDAYETAISAIRGPQPDPITGLVPCDFCTDTFDQKPLLQENKYEPYTCMMSTISIEENNGKHQIEIDLWDGGNVYAAFEINYCPMCGRKLTAPSPSGAIGPEPDRTAPNGDKGANK
jgi:hypothetical protein